MSLKETVKQLRSLLQGVSSDLDKAEAGNKAASQRVRTGTIKIEKTAKLFRKESVKAEKSGSFKKSKKTGKSSSAKSPAQSASSKGSSKSPKSQSGSSSKGKQKKVATAKSSGGKSKGKAKKATAKIIKKK